jgi:hypothetical protein
MRPTQLQGTGCNLTFLKILFVEEHTDNGMILNVKYFNDGGINIENY